MIELRGKVKAVNMGIINPMEILIETKNVKAYDDVKKYIGKDCNISIKTYREKRSLNANAYFWQLCGKLSEKTGIPKNEIYRNSIKEIGVYRSVEINEKAVDTLITSWGLHGTGWIAERVDYAEHEGFVKINLYYGSSKYNSKQMSRLIDNIVQDCKEQGIETMTPAELDALKKEWAKDEIR